MTRLILLCVLTLAFLFSLRQVHARDLGQWEDLDPELRSWYQALRQPDNPQVSCCGESDAYWCDEIWAEGEHNYCKITDTRDDVPLRRPHRDVGTVFQIPPHKYQGRYGNPTGHSIIFLSYAGDVYCFVMQGGV